MRYWGNNANSFSLQENYSRPFYDTGEHAILGEFINAVVSGPLAGVQPLQPTTTYKLGQPNGVFFTYGQIMTMGDFYKDYDSCNKASDIELTNLKKLIVRGEDFYKKSITGLNIGPGAINPETKDWKDKTTGIGDRYIDLALENYSHFAPPYPGAKTTTLNNQNVWETYHDWAIKIARTGLPNKAEALEIAYKVNAFGDHFLTDAFSAGHIINKENVLQRFIGNCFTGGSLNSAGDSMIERIADGALAIAGIKSELSKWETTSGGSAATVAGTILGGPLGGIIAHEVVGAGPDLDTTKPIKIFYRVLKGVFEDSIGKIQIANLAVDAVHYFLNHYPGGLPVWNKKGTSWKLTGDGTLNLDNIKIIQLAVKQSVENITEALANPAIPTATYVKKVWDYVPDITLGTTKAEVEKVVANYTNPNSLDLIRKAVDLLKTELPVLLEKLKDKKIIVRK